MYLYRIVAYVGNNIQRLRSKLKIFHNGMIFFDVIDDISRHFKSCNFYKEELKYFCFALEYKQEF